MPHILKDTPNINLNMDTLLRQPPLLMPNLFILQRILVLSLRNLNHSRNHNHNHTANLLLNSSNLISSHTANLLNNNSLNSNNLTQLLTNRSPKPKPKPKPNLNLNRLLKGHHMYTIRTELTPIQMFKHGLSITLKVVPTSLEQYISFRFQESKRRRAKLHPRLPRRPNSHKDTTLANLLRKTQCTRILEMLEVIRTLASPRSQPRANRLLAPQQFIKGSPLAMRRDKNKVTTNRSSKHSIHRNLTHLVPQIQHLRLAISLSLNHNKC